MKKHIYLLALLSLIFISCSGRSPRPVSQTNGIVLRDSTEPISSDEAEVRYIITDIQLGEADRYYRQLLNQPTIAEAIHRWDAGVRVVNSYQFERKIVGSWIITYAGTEKQINGLDVVLSTDTPTGLATCNLAGIAHPIYSTNFIHGWLSESRELAGGYDYSNGGQVTFLRPGVQFSATQGQTAFISFQPFWGMVAIRLVNNAAYKIALVEMGSGSLWTKLLQKDIGGVSMVLDVNNQVDPNAGVYYKKFGESGLMLLNNNSWDMVKGDEYTVFFDLNNQLFKLFDKKGRLVVKEDISHFWGPEITGHIPMGSFPFWIIGAGWTDTTYPTDLLIEEVCYG